MLYGRRGSLKRVAELSTAELGWTRVVGERERERGRAKSDEEEARFAVGLLHSSAYFAAFPRTERRSAYTYSSVFPATYRRRCRKPSRYNAMRLCSSRWDARRTHQMTTSGIQYNKSLHQFESSSTVHLTIAVAHEDKAEKVCRLASAKSARCDGKSQRPLARHNERACSYLRSRSISSRKG